MKNTWKVLVLSMVTQGGQNIMKSTLSCLSGLNNIISEYLLLYDKLAYFEKRCDFIYWGKPGQSYLIQ